MTKYWDKKASLAVVDRSAWRRSETHNEVVKHWALGVPNIKGNGKRMETLVGSLERA